ncbi:hypothetical protein TVAG_446620 [Trichomonas vaginalis G3]|uniref:Cytoplasmic tRNA 2-thiolation protein 2 n=1 Tax=Trichomonas vaginalis (strain ATCC PRA-98 / G3) TaxID=412133 RepID=A2E8M1_TRIV3|nr:cytoplasmic tRNA 2-thiolation protein 2 family [Trichomonas vaginalis G3]EAY10960.1 hypothetical protein TVAG_446620 [Trichomonas vaginalis G3]KAI5530847.1 cytoplasmic tRNA 2-thiolation protein 2 family [Trichomonas vaginalis G3]|eukprot:XP_001323183.1 hypothetical protein [Trichomonas vaginalis G3]
MSGICPGCKQEKELFALRKCTPKCDNCTCEQIGKQYMNIFRKSTMELKRHTLNILVAVSGGPCSMFAYTILTERVDTKRPGKSSAIRKIEPISTKQLDLPNLHHIDKFTVKNVVDYAENHDFNCVVFGDSMDFITLKILGYISLGRPDLIPYIAGNDFTTYKNVAILRPARTLLTSELKFWCDTHHVATTNEKSLLQKEFEVEKHMLDNIIADGNDTTVHSVQSMGEKMPQTKYTEKCPICGLPAETSESPCAICLVEAKSI